MPPPADSHYLKQDLYRRVREDPEIFEFLQSGSLDGIWYRDIERPEEEWLSPRFKSVFGYEDHEVPNTAEWWQQNIHPDDLRLARENLQRHCEDPSHPYDQVVRYRHKDGSTVWVRCRGLAIRDADGKPIRMLGVHTDVTALKKAQRDLELLSVQLRGSNNELDQLASAASHDLRAPLRHIAFLAEWVLEDSADKLGEESKDYLRTLRERILHMDRLLMDLLDYARPEIGEPEDLDCAEVARKAVELAEAPEGFSFELPEGPVLVRTERSPLVLTLLNLVTNAVKHHGGDKGHVRLSAKAGEDGWVVFEVADDGKGIPPEQQDRAFSMFERVHAKGPDGTGMGLTLVKKLVEKHSGSIEVESDVDAGATFRFSWKGEPV